MSQQIPAMITPSLLVWAREEAGYALEQAAAKSGYAADKLRAWESGERRPTLRQAEKLAKLYHRPYSVLCLERPPVTTPLAKEYRRLPGVKPGSESPELRFVLREMIHRRRLALHLFDEVGDEVPVLEEHATLDEAPSAVAIRLRNTLGITAEAQFSWTDEWQAWREWRSAVESVGVLVFQFSKVSPEEVRGLSLLDLPLPVIGINSKEIPQSKPFTLLHELVHLLLSCAHEERPALDENRPSQEWEKVEKFAEAVAGAVLMPENLLQNDPVVGRHAPSTEWDIHEARKVARRFKVTPSALLTRLLMMGRCTPIVYKNWKKNWEQYLKDHPPSSGGGIATPPQKALNRNGAPFTRLVLEAYSSERITSTDAAYYLGVNLTHVEALRRQFMF